MAFSRRYADISHRQPCHVDAQYRKAQIFYRLDAEHDNSINMVGFLSAMTPKSTPYVIIAGIRLDADYALFPIKKKTPAWQRRHDEVKPSRGGWR